ncbi:predicted protein [Verticillium alfalfae VaMs.102]|uniref:Predicted protein n=1 Tax=Verticillium alfalfae (strain VaMs.102 / ATCC MYA-4576 / FGSC 10136) TaxID=526221 RepID=C9SM26_VERA1|nr:predicted protein [Verticillium alfalfae VaMs.102]EEY19841.1 predicted protein [Verticillium alfalfae VaMs.102]
MPHIPLCCSLVEHCAAPRSATAWARGIAGVDGPPDFDTRSAREPWLSRRRVGRSACNAWVKGKIGCAKGLDEGPTSDHKVDTLLYIPRPYAKGRSRLESLAELFVVIQYAHPELIAVPGKWALTPLAKPVTWQASTKGCLGGRRSSENPNSIMRSVEFVLPLHHERLVIILLDQT